MLFVRLLCDKKTKTAVNKKKSFLITKSLNLFVAFFAGNKKFRFGAACRLSDCFL